MDITRLLRDLANAGVKVTFEDDWGDNTLTVSMESRKEIFSYGKVTQGEMETIPSRYTQTHLGFPGATEEELHDQLKKLLETTLHKAERAD